MTNLNPSWVSFIDNYLPEFVEKHADAQIRAFTYLMVEIAREAYFCGAKNSLEQLAYSLEEDLNLPNDIWPEINELLNQIIGEVE